MNPNDVAGQAGPKILSARFGRKDGHRLPVYEQEGGYTALRKVLGGMQPDEVTALVKESGLRGRGGAGFPTGTKWGFVPKGAEQVYFFVNADESEPGTFKDRFLLDYDPHQTIEGTIISCFAVRANLGFIYIRGEFGWLIDRVQKAVDECYAAGYLGKNILGSGYDLEMIVHKGAGAYICGEETGLINSVEGRKGQPSIKPPYFPAVLGLYQCPTIVNNVETLCHVKHIVAMGGEAYGKIGTPGNTGTRIFCVSGHVQRPGYYEFEAGRITLGQLVNEVCGGPLPGRTLKAVIPGGSSAKILRFGERFKGKRKVGAALVDYDWGVEDVPMDFDSLGMIGTMGGSGGVIVMDDSVRMVDALANINAFYAHESCGQCTPCREGSLWMKRITTRMVHGTARPEDAALLQSVADQIPGRTICAFGEACSWPTQSFLAKFGDEFRQYPVTKQTPPPAGTPALV